MPSDGLNADIVRAIAAGLGIQIVQSLTLPVREASYRAIPDRLHPSVVARLKQDYPSGLFRHQALAINAFLDGRDVALSTSTASGKSLVFITAAMDTLAKDPSARVLALYPAKALIRDQIAKWKSATRHDPTIGVGLIDGNVSIDSRGEILAASRIVLMTPDVAHAWFMPNLRERQISMFRSALRLLVLDEAHVYEGVFGTNTAYLMRRLDATTGSHRVLCSTATLGRPSDFIFQLTGRSAVSITQDDEGSPAPERQVFVAGDPGYDKLVELLKNLAAVDRGRFLAFSDSRKMVEQMVAATMRVESQAALADDESDSEDEIEERAARQEPTGPQAILPFRAGYEAEDAREIQDALYRGKLGGVVSTSAMELGLDIGEIDLVVLLGLPPSLKAFRQRLGRAGRRREGACLVIDTKGVISGIEQGLAKYMAKPLEPSWLYLENRYLQYANVLCAALECSELGLTSADKVSFSTLPSSFGRLLENELNPVETVPADLYPLKQRAQAGPHREFPLRSGIEKDFKINSPQGENLGNVTFSQMLREAYPGAIYYYMARPFRVIRMDMRDGKLSARRTKFWTTRPIANTTVFPKFNGGVLRLFGSPGGFLAEAELQVSERVTGFQEMRGRTRLEPHLYGPASEWYRRELTRFFETTGVCLYQPDRAGSLEEIGVQILRAFCIDYGVQERDIGIGFFHAKQTPFGTSKKCQGLCIYDAVDGSLRLTQRLADNFSQTIRSAIDYSQTDGMADTAKQLEALYEAFSKMEEVAVTSGLAIEPLSTPDDWVEIIAAGEKAMYTSEDGPREVSVIGYRFTPKGLMYELFPETDEGSGKWMVTDRAIHPLNGMTRTVWANLVTGEEQAAAPESTQDET